MRIITLSLDGIQQAQSRGLFRWLSGQDADIICLQDLRLPVATVESEPKYQLDGFYGYFHEASSVTGLGATDLSAEGSSTTGYGNEVLQDEAPQDDGLAVLPSVAIYTRHVPKALMYSFTGSDAAMDGRFLQADFDEFSVASLMLPPSDVSGDINNCPQQHFFDRWSAHLNKIKQKRRQYVFAGHWFRYLNSTDSVAPDPQHRVVFDQDAEEHLASCYRSLGYADAFATQSQPQSHNQVTAMSYWPSGVPGSGAGYRSDLQVISGDLATQVTRAWLYQGQTFSSHLPLVADYDVTLV